MTTASTQSTPTYTPPPPRPSLSPDIEWRENEMGELAPFVRGTTRQIIWAPQPGSQEAFLTCPIFETLYEGSRGGGKTDTLLMDFAQHVGKGFGAEWRGVLFRKTYPELQDVVEKAKKWFPRIWPGSGMHETKHQWEWETGERLLFRHADKPGDYWKYHGCVDEGEVLTTHRGWQDIRDIQVGEEVVSVTPDGTVTSQRVTATFAKQHDGPLIRYEGRGRFMSFTPEHKLAVASTSDNSHTLIPFRDCPRDIPLRTGGWAMPEQPSTLRVPACFPHATPGDYCEFMGWFLSEGWSLKPTTRKKSTTCGISQSKQVNPKKYEQIHALLQRMLPDKKLRATPRDVQWSAGKEQHAFLRSFGGVYEKFVPRGIIEHATRAELRRFLDAFIDGDGTRQGTRLYAFSSSPKLLDGVSEIATRLGYSTHHTTRMRDLPSVTHSGREIRATVPSGCVALNPRPVLNLRTNNRKRAERNGVPSKKIQTKQVPYSGPVYCIEVEETHCFFIRQRGSTWLSGNSSFPWIAWEELTTWANLDLYTSMMSICRSTVRAIPRKYRATTNPYGPGHNIVKARFKLPLPPSEIIHRPLTDERGQQRVAIRSNVYENRVLLHADPGYIARIAASAPNPAALRAWLEGNWDVVAGGMIDDVWVPSVHIIPNVSPDQIPAGWRIDRSYDHGQSRPFSVGWWAESDGTPITLQKTVFTPHGPTTTTITVGEVQGDLVRIAEWYGCSGEPNKGLNLDPLSEIAPGIRSREESMGIARRVRPGPADTAIYDSYSPGRSVAGDMKKGGVTWTRADKGPGSRKQGWQQIRRLLRGSLGLGDESPVEEFHREKPIIDPATGLPVPRPRKHPGMWVCERCTDFVRTVPALPRDDKDPDDVDTRSEDHIGDEVRYRVRRRSTDVKQRNF